jgi:hypothetical protein
MFSAWARIFFQGSSWQGTIGMKVFGLRIVDQAGNGSLKLEGVYPGYDGSFTYPLKLNDE